MKRTVWMLLIALSIGTASWAGPPAGDEWVASLEGGWSGDDNATPMGRMSFAVLFERQDDGSLRSFTAMNRETYVELVLRKSDDGRWLMDERAAMEGLGEQFYTLEPVEAPGELRRWVLAERPGFLSVDLAVDGELMFMNVMLRGEEHAQFRMQRVPEDEVEAMREEFARAAELEPDQQSIHAFANDESVPPAILSARAAVAAEPESAEAHLELGKVIGPLLSADPMTMGPRYAGEMLASLQRAVELDPTLGEAYQWLAGYYLNAPPIAGGSIDKAEQLARRLSEFDPTSGEALMSQVRERRGAN